MRNFILDNALVFGVFGHLVEDRAVDSVANVSDNHNRYGQYEERIRRRGGLGVHGFGFPCVIDSTMAQRGELFDLSC